MNCLTNNAAGKVLLRLNRLEEALADMNSLLDVIPNDQPGRYRRGEILHRLGMCACLCM